MRIKAGLLLTYAKVTGGRAPVLMMQARSNPVDSNWRGVSSALRALVRLWRRCAVRLV